MNDRTEGPIRTRREGGVLEVTLDRPKANAIDLATSRIMGQVFRGFRDDDSLRVAILRAEGDKFFCPGWDLKAAAGGDAVDGDYGVGGFGGLQELPNLNKPVIAAVNGPAMGVGMAPIVNADIIFASDNAFFCMPEIDIGLMGGARHTMKIFPHSLARRMILSGYRLPAAEAYRRGIIEACVPLEELMPTAMELARNIASKSPKAISLAKRAINTVENMPLRDGYRFEQNLTNEMVQHEDSKEAMRAFLEKRKPVFKDEI